MNILQEEFQSLNGTVGSNIEIVGFYNHQVGGHAPFLVAQGGKVCKPLIAQEYWFYTTLEHRAMWREWTPRVYGSFEISQQKLHEWAKRTTIAELRQESELDSPDEHSHSWKEEMMDRMEKTLSSSMDIEPNFLHKYMVIEDLGRNYEHPCVMDIKIGTRQYGDFATPEKIQRQNHKTETTTSKPLGVRLCGYKIFSRKTKTAIEVDKYEHRKLTTETIIDSLYTFFSTGSKLRTSIVKQFIVKLEKLLLLIESNSHYRIYSSSLLFMYEGAKRERTPEVTLKMIDFAHTYTLEPGQESDDGYKLGLINLIDCLQKVLSAESKHKVPRITSDDPHLEHSVFALS